MSKMFWTKNRRTEKYYGIAWKNRIFFVVTTRVFSEKKMHHNKTNTLKNSIERKMKWKKKKKLRKLYFI